MKNKQRCPEEVQRRSRVASFRWHLYLNSCSPSTEIISSTASHGKKLTAEGISFYYPLENKMLRIHKNLQLSWTKKYRSVLKEILYSYSILDHKGQLPFTYLNPANESKRGFLAVSWQEQLQGHQTCG